MKVLQKVVQLFCAYQLTYETLSICNPHVYESAENGKAVVRN